MIDSDNHSFLPHVLKSLLLGHACLILLLVYTTTFSYAQKDATNSTVSEETIKENLKERLKNVIRDNQVERIVTKRAWVGNLASIANNTLTIETRYGPRLASVSAETTFVLLPKRASISAEDLVIGSHTIAMGVVNENQVLNTTRVVIEEDPEETPKRVAHFVRISQFNEKTDELEVILTSGEVQTLEITKKTEVSLNNDTEIENGSTDDLVQGEHAIIIVEINMGANDEERLLLRIHLLAKNAEEDVVIGPEIDQSSQESTQSSHQ